MLTNRIILSGLILVCLSISAPCLAQADRAKTQIVYTGKLMGYFRAPSKQPGDATRGCPASENSAAAIKFQAVRDNNRDAVLVATGDNFAPQLEARTFSPPPPRSTSKVPGDDYLPGNKELYYWNETTIAGVTSRNWIFYKDLENHPDLKERLTLGTSTIPTDNVGCFLAAARFAAVVPGKHDFYFGVERVRQLARFMASLTSSDLPGVYLAPDYRPPQMLGANLVIKTSSTLAPSSVPSKPKSKWPEGSSVRIGDGKSVYPWFSSAVSVKISTPESATVKDAIGGWFKAHPDPSLGAVETFFHTQAQGATDETKEDWEKLEKVAHGLKEIKVCPTNDFNEIAKGCGDGCEVKPKPEGAVSFKPEKPEQITYTISIPANPDPKKPWTQDKKVPTFEPGRNYGLCQTNTESKEPDIETGCQIFSVNRPFLSFPRGVVSATGTNYTDPDPFVVVPNADPNREVAIFGVVDPNITKQIGVLNYTWLNEDQTLKSGLSAEDPAEALKQQLDYFDSWYRATHDSREFKGLKILLAQMSPQQAKVLAARLKKFQLVVAEADEQQATSEVKLSTEWNKDLSASALIAVPAPYFGSGLKEDVEGKVHFGMVEAENVSDKWKLQSKEISPLDVNAKFMKDEEVADKIRPSLKSCVAEKFFDKTKYPLKAAETVQLATLCAMRQQLRADVALIQKRDRFERVPYGLTDPQQILDHLIWKGDFLTLVYVPGSALKKTLDLSKKYDDEDSDNLSLSDQRLRALESIGFLKPDKDYVINEKPLDDKTIYAVATTDFIAAGDTAYPDLAAAALNPRTRASQFPNQLQPISGLVCGQLDPTQAKLNCLAAFPRDSYLDSIMVTAAPAPRPPGFGSKFWNLFPIKFADKDGPTTNVSGALNQEVQRRPIWMLSLKNFSFQFNGLNNNDTDISIDNKFGGIATSGVNSHENHSMVVGLDLRLVRSRHNYDWFGATGIDYNTKSSDTSSAAPSVVQNTNRLTGDAGFLWNLWGGRSSVRWGPVFTFRAETQLAQPFTIFNLNTSSTDTEGRTLTDQKKISPERSVLLMGRAGLRSQNRTNAFEFGFEQGRELNVLMGYEFVTNGGTVRCIPDATTSLSKCIKDAIKAGKITKDSVVLSAHQNRPRTGFYWKWNISIPFNQKLKFELTDEGDFYFADSARDILNDTRFRDISKSSLKFQVFPNLSIGPSLNLLLYQNQTGFDSNFKPIGGDFLSQKTFGFEASFSFNWFNWREPGVQIKNKP
jgi:5'-nucleotidase, C-terminal domain